MKLIVGLGNPDKQYQNTFHNLGFMCVEKCAEIFGATFSKEKCKASIAEINYNGEKVIFAKPLTYMNLSGEAVRELMNFYKIESKDLLVMYDDFDLSKGMVRIREEGSSGTHNGMRNIVKEIGTTFFPRMRVGFKPENMVMPLVDLVLSGIRGDDVAIFDEATSTVANAGAEFIKGIPIKDIIQKYSGNVIK